MNGLEGHETRVESWVQGRRVKDSGSIVLDKPNDATKLEEKLNGH